MTKLLRAGDILFHPDSVIDVDVTDIESLTIMVTTRDGVTHCLKENDTLEAIMVLKPSALEGKRLRWAKNAWLIHNMVGHPLMQLLSMFGFYKQAIQIHDATVPRPRGVKKPKT